MRRSRAASSPWTPSADPSRSASRAVLASVINHPTIMRTVDISHIKIGDTLALSERDRSWAPSPSHRLLSVFRVTATQVCCTDDRTGAGEWRFRKSDGRLIGEDYVYAEIATPELIASVKDQRERLARHRKAREAVNDLEGKHLHQLHLSLEQLEALAMAWTTIKAMKPAA